jgi:hypothetical protein
MTAPNYRKERIERLLKELEYKITLGIMQHEIEEEIAFRFYVPRPSATPLKYVVAEFRTRPASSYETSFYQDTPVPVLRVVGEEK